MRDQIDKLCEQALVAYGMDAAVGRRYRGLTHNLNGVAQAFSMQTELLGLFLNRIGEILQQLEQVQTPEEARALGRNLGEALKRRASLVVHLEKEVRIIREITQRISQQLLPSDDNPDAGGLKLRSIIETELEFMNADKFFKHRVSKELFLEKNLTVCPGQVIDIHQIIGALLENSAQALAEKEVATGLQPPTIRVSGQELEGMIVVKIMDNGPGIAEEDQEQIFAPFFTTHPERQGLGLYLARKLADRCHGTLECLVQPEWTGFTLRLPREEAGLCQITR